jgi:hypothetical protein
MVYNKHPQDSCLAYLSLLWLSALRDIILLLALLPTPPTVLYTRSSVRTLQEIFFVNLLCFTFTTFYEASQVEVNYERWQSRQGRGVLQASRRQIGTELDYLSLCTPLLA